MEEKQKEKIKHQPKFWEFEILIQRIVITELGGWWNFKAKPKEHLANLDKVDGKDLFETIMTKWKWNHDCKDKWGAIAKKFKI